MRVLIVVLAAVAAFAASPTQIAIASVASESDAISECLMQNRTTGLNTKKLVEGLGLTPDQVREARGRLSSNNPLGSYELDGFGLTPEQITEIERRIKVQFAVMNKYPLGYPCKPFKNGAKVVAFVKAELLANGFRQKPMTFTKTSPRQFQFRAIQDGVDMTGVIAKSGPRQIAISLASIDRSWGQVKRFSVPFEA